MEHELFAVDEMVVWRDEYADTPEKREILTEGKKKFGEGPFLVTAVRDVDDSPAHPQTVTIRLSPDKTLPFSGAWFKHVRH